MLSKILKIATPILLIFIILFIGYNSYKQVTENTENPLNIIPTNAALILQCNDANELYSSLNSTNIWGYLRNISTVDSINSQIKEISSFYNQYPLIFKSHTLFISFHKVGANNSGLLFSSNFERKEIATNTEINNLLGNAIAEGEYNNEPIFELLHKGSTLFVSFKGDIVFFSHKWCGLIAAAKVKGEVKAPDSETLYRDVEFLTPIPNRDDNTLLAMPFSEVSAKTGKSFFWARTIKVPYLTKSEALELVDELNNYLHRT